MKRMKLTMIAFLILDTVSKVNSQTIFPTDTTINYNCTYRKLFDEDKKDISFSLSTRYSSVYKSANLVIVKCVNFPFLKFVDFDVSNIKDIDTSFLVIIKNFFYYYSFYKPVYIKLVSGLLNHKISENVFIEKMKQTNYLLISESQKVEKYADKGDFPSFLSDRASGNSYKISFKDRNETGSFVLDKRIGFTSIKYIWERNAAYEVKCNVSNK